MAVRGRDEFYVYRIFDGFETVYVGKGSGGRLAAQRRNFRLAGEVIERCDSDDHAFERERHWISTLHPSENKNPGGNGGRGHPKRKSLIRKTKEEKDIELYGAKRYAAMLLVSRLAEFNCERWGVSKTDLSRLRVVAAGG